MNTMFEPDSVIEIFEDSVAGNPLYTITESVLDHGQWECLKRLSFYSLHETIAHVFFLANMRQGFGCAIVQIPKTDNGGAYAPDSDICPRINMFFIYKRGRWEVVPDKETL